LNESVWGVRRGYLYVVGAALLWASSGVAGKALFASGVTPLELVQVRVTLSSLLLAAVFAAVSPGLFRIRPRDVGYFFVLGGVAMALVQVSYFSAIARIQVAAAILLEYLAPVLVAGFSLLFWHERPTLTKLSALALAVGGCYLVVGAYDLDLLRMNRVGVGFGLASGVFFAAYSLLGERGMHRYRPPTVLFYALFFAAVSLHVHRPFHYLSAGYTARQWGSILYITVAGTVVPFGLYFLGINHIRSTRASITATLEPIAAGFVAFFALGESLALPQILGGLLVIAAVALLQLQAEHDQHAPALIRARRGGPPAT
jgi:drug/metabolite transporter (DMT)-like permease